LNEIYEFRVDEDYAARLFGPDEGVRLGDTIRKVTIGADDPRLPTVGELQNELRLTCKKPFFYGWDIRYRYTKQELAAAELFHLHITAAFEPPGEMCGTVYDESTACPNCGVGMTRVSDLVLDLRKAPKSKDIARTIADEWIVSQRLAQIMMDADLTGFELHPVRHKARYEDDAVDFERVPSGRELLRRAQAAGAPHPTWEFWVWLNRAEQRALSERADSEHAELLRRRAIRRGKPVPVWYELRVVSHPVAIVPPTRLGVAPFDYDTVGENPCPLKHISGLNLLSEVSVSRKDWDGSDIVCTTNLVGVRRGVLVACPLLLISPKFWRLLQDEKIKGYRANVAYLR
jgi:hypothetical protein